MSVENFQFATASRIVFGRGSATAQISSICNQFAPDGGIFVIHSGLKPREEVSGVLDKISDKICGVFAVPKGEPSMETAEKGALAAKASKARAIVAIGGGSVLDVGKAVAALVANGGAVLDYIEVIGRGMPLREPALPMIAIPTTAGTGAEVTKNAVLMSTEHGVKASMRAESMLPRVAIVDPALTDSCPASVTIASGLDALTQCIEPYVSCAHNPLTDALCLAGIERAARALSHIYSSGDKFEFSAQDRDEMCVASLFGGLCLANAKLGIVHGIAGPLGGMLEHAPHGALCGAILPHGMRANVSAILALDESDPRRAEFLERYRRVAVALTGRIDATVDDGLDFVQQLVIKLKAPKLGEMGLRESKFEQLAQKALRAGSTKGNALPLTEEQIRSIVSAAM